VIVCKWCENAKIRKQRDMGLITVTATTTPKWCDPETMTLEQIDENTRRPLQEWPKDNGTPFPMEILEVLRDLKLRVRAQDAEKTCSTTVSVATSTDTAGVICTPAPVHLVIDASEANTFVLDLWDSISITTNNSVDPTTAMTDLWQKTAKNGKKGSKNHLPTQLLQHSCAIIRTDPIKGPTSHSHHPRTSGSKYISTHANTNTSPRSNTSSIFTSRNINSELKPNRV
jgi:hypothetical protein